MLHMRGVIDCPRVIPPVGVPPMDPYAFSELEWVLQRIGFDKKWPDIP